MNNHNCNSCPWFSLKIQLTWLLGSMTWSEWSPFQLLSFSYSNNNKIYLGLYKGTGQKEREWSMIPGNQPKHQKSAGNPEFSEYRRKAGAIRSLSEACSGENDMNGIFSAALRIHWTLSIQTWSGPFDKSGIQTLGEDKTGQTWLRQAMPEAQYNFSLAREHGLD